MSISKKVYSYILHQRYGRVFTLDDFLNSSGLHSDKAAVITAFSRYAKQCELQKLSPGVFFKPKKSKFGNLPVDTHELIEAYSRKKQAEYVISGLAAVNALGLSTQLPMVRSYLMTERVRAELGSVNIKIEYSKALQHFTENLSIKDKRLKEKSLLFWSALHYLEKDRFEDYREELLDCFAELFNVNAQKKFLEALPPSMKWAKLELNDNFEVLIKTVNYQQKKCSKKNEQPEHLKSIRHFKKYDNFKTCSKNESVTLLTDALTFINKSQFHDYKESFFVYFSNMLSENDKSVFIENLPHNIKWIKKELRSDFEQVFKAKSRR